MSSIIYVVPWAICDTDNMYIKKVNSDEAPPLEKGMEVDEEWCLSKIVPNPDRRSKDVYAIVDVYNTQTDKSQDKGMSVIALNNSANKLISKGYVKATEAEREYILSKVLKLDKKNKK